MDLDKKNKRLKILKNILSLYLILAIVGIMGLVLSYITGKSSCAFYILIGVPCPSCGMTRAVKAFFTVGIKEAIYYHPLFLILPFFPLTLIIREKSKKAFAVVIWSLVGLIFTTWIIRLIIFFPQREPMNFNKDGVLPNLFGYRFIK